MDRLVSHLFDYAGMFPPAALSFEDALAESAKFPEQLRRPHLVAADMVLTPDNLGKLDDQALAAAGFADRPCHICIVGVPLGKGLEQAQAIVSFNEERRHAPVPQKIVAIELHAETLDDAPELLRDIRRVASGVDIYFEPKLDNQNLAPILDETIGMLHGLRSDGAPIGLKLRCAGPTQLSYKLLAQAIIGVNRHRIPLKLTQGLHYPFANDSEHKNPHGFINAVVGLRLQRTLALDPETLEELLADPDEASFHWDNGLGWRGYRALAQGVEEGAQAVPFAIGSCSLRDPDAGLKVILG